MSLVNHHTCIKPTVTKIAGGFSFVEGPLWHPDKYFLFSDTPANRIYRLSVSGNVDVFLENSGWNGKNADLLSDQRGSNALAFDSQQNLYVCQHGNHGIAVLDREMNLKPLITAFNNRPFNSPNDLLFRSDGRLYFSDPPYGLAGQVLNQTVFQPVAGIYSYDGREVQLMSDDLQYPNGLCFSPTEELLYVSSMHPDDPGVLKYKVNKDGSLEYAGIFIAQQADGITRDKRGNLYLATEQGIMIVSPGGEQTGLCKLPGWPSNLSWAMDETLLFVTAGDSIYFVEDLVS